MSQSDAPLVNVVSSPRHFFDRLEAFLGAVANRVATLGVLGMLTAAVITVSDIVMRWFFISGVVALNEIVTMAFVIAISACIPAGLSRGANVTVDLLTGAMTPRTAEVLKAVGAILLICFVALLSWCIYSYADTLAAQRRSTVVLNVLQAPFFYASAALLAFGAVVQTVIAINAARAVAAVPKAERWTLSSLVVILLGVLTVVALLLVWLNIGAVSRWAQTNLMWTGLISFGVMWFLLLGMVPLSVVLAAVGIGGGILFIGLNPSLSVFGSEAARFLTDYHIATLPLFLLMGSFAAIAGISDDIFRISQAMFGKYRGGLAMSTIGGCAGFGAVTGSSLPTVAMFGQIALPQMRQRKYAPEFAIGCVAAGGTLGALIPPSSVLIIYALLTEASIGQLFMAAIIPALLATLLYILTVAVTVRLVPGYAPPPDNRAVPGELRNALTSSSAFIAVFGVVMGGLYTGLFTATEAAAVGAVGAFLMALLRGRLNPSLFWQAMGATTHSTALIYTLIFGVVMFSFFIAITDLPAVFTAIIEAIPYPPIVILIIIVFFLVLLGCVMDSMSILLITTPILVPLVLNLGYDLIWWGIISLVVVEIGLITPPLGLHLFMLKSMAPDVSLPRIFGAILPFCVADIIKLTLLIAIPAIALWLPSTMF